MARVRRNRPDVASAELNPSGPVQAKTAFGAGDDPESVAVVSMQLSESPAAAAPGGAVSAITVAVAVLLHPVLPSVTSRV